MRRGIVKVLPALLGLALLIPGDVMSVYADNVPGVHSAADTADETENPDTDLFYRYLAISTPEDFFAFAENCRLDSYSRNLKVELAADIDLGDESFEGIPVFCGEFEGNGYLISGLKVTGEGSVRGLFRYLADTALVRNLNVEGEIAPTGTRCDVGGIVGNNAGKIINCSFDGTVSGADNVGGIAGINEVTGIIEKCHVDGMVTGNHFLGGMVGNNFGVVRRGINSALINATVEQNSVGISDITIESLTGSESVATVTDIGGIAGNSSGVLRNCINYSQVGYLQIGYNVGGIAGRQVGYVVDCMNYGNVYGRKEVGGIIGHQEPNVLLVYEIDTLQTLEGQLNTMETLTNRATANAQSGANKLNNQMNTMNNYAKTAQESANAMKQMYESGEYDEDSMIASRNTLGESLKGMNATMESMAATTRNTTYTLNKNMQAINNQMNVINNTLDNAEEGLGGEVKDVSDEDTEELMSSEVFSCDNYGRVDGELNVGGIVGLIALETDLDSTEDVDILGDMSMNFVSEMRSVVLENKNRGAVVVKKQYGGGIVGRQDLGLIKECTNVGTIEGGAADFVGGIAGQSLSYIRSCNAKCVLKGTNNVGGIAGSGVIASDCLSMVEIQGGVEMLGSVFGLCQEDIKGEEAPVAGNYYVVTDVDRGAIDGISYADCAEPMKRDVFMAMDNLPDVFKVVTVQFWADGEEVDTITLKIGTDLLPEQIPQIPAKAGMEGTWDGLEESDLTQIVFDLRYDALYRANEAALRSDAVGTDGKPVILVLGEFAPDRKVITSEMRGINIGREKGGLVEAWEYALDGTGEISEVRFLVPARANENSLLWIRDALGVWRAGTYRIDGSYMVFSVNAEDDAFALTNVGGTNFRGTWIIAGAAVLLIIVLIGIRIRKTVKNNNKNKITES